MGKNTDQKGREGIRYFDGIPEGIVDFVRRGADLNAVDDGGQVCHKNTHPITPELLPASTYVH